MLFRKANAVWEGTLKGGAGRLRLGSSRWEGPYSFSSRFESGDGTNPEELVGAAIAGCFSMALAAKLEETGHKPEIIRSDAEVGLEKTDKGFMIGKIRLMTTAVVPGIAESDFIAAAEEAKRGCPVSKALSGVGIELHAGLARKEPMLPGLEK
jgi:osmotically inducible protein OsmC